MKLFLDTTDTMVLKALSETGLVDGVTTNPSLIAKSGRNMLEVIAEICGLVEGPISAEAVATDFETMVKEGDKLAAIAPNVVVKLPLTWDGLRAAHCTNATVPGGRVGSSTRSTTCFRGRLPPAPSRRAVTTPPTRRGPSGTMTMSPTLSPISSGSS